MTQETNTENVAQDRQLTEEQLKEIRQQAINFYNEETPFLEKQAQYEKLIADIEESRLKRLKAMVQYAQINAAMDSAEEQQNSKNSEKVSEDVTLNQEKPVRKLAKE